MEKKWKLKRQCTIPPKCIAVHFKDHCVCKYTYLSDLLKEESNFLDLGVAALGIEKEISESSLSTQKHNKLCLYTILLTSWESIIAVIIIHCTCIITHTWMYTT